MSYATEEVVSKIGGMDFHGKLKMSFSPGALKYEKVIFRDYE